MHRIEPPCRNTRVIPSTLSSISVPLFVTAGRLSAQKRFAITNGTPGMYLSIDAFAVLFRPRAMHNDRETAQLGAW